MNVSSFEFSIVMPVYNVEEYLRESIDSVINQSIGFSDNIQLILINDGSPDNADEICLEYKGKFPDNIIYINKENEGVSVARNIGLDEAKGKYINFLDSDDYLDSDALKKVKRFFDAHGEVVDLVAIPVVFFEGRTGDHRLNFKFKQEKEIIDIKDNPNYIQLSAASTFIKREEGIGDLRLTPGQKYGEDASLLTDIIMKKGKYGVINTTNYNYRIRNAGTSALQNSEESYDYYLPFFKEYSIPKLKSYFEKYGEVPKYVQNVIMYDVQWRIRLKEIPEVIQSELDEYYGSILEILFYIDKDVIMKQKYLNWYQRHALCNMKETKKRFILGKGFYKTEKRVNKRKKMKINDYVVVDNDNSVKDYLFNRSLEIDLCEIRGGNLSIIGRLGSLFPQENMKVYALDSNDNYISPKGYDFPTEDRYMTGEVIYKFFGFQFDISLEELKKTRTIRVFLEIDGNVVQVPLKFSSSARLSNKITNSYFVYNNELMIGYNHKKNRFDINKYSLKQMIKKEKMVRAELGRKKVKNYKKISNMRILVRLLKMVKKTPINLFMDRIDKADDSAEVLINYFEKEKKKKKQRNYFVLTKTSPDYKRLKERFKVIPYKGRVHKILFLLADNLISTHCDRFIYQLYTGTDNYFKDLKEFNFIFLQHGIIKDDMSDWLKRHDKNFRLFITSTPLEQRSIINGNYGYTSNEVKLTGLPRFDNLVDNANIKEKILLVMPTWRKGIIEEFSKELNKRPYSEKFKETEFFLNWNAFLSNDILHKNLKKAGYKIVFVPHPSIRQQIRDFNIENVEIASYTESYSSLLKRGSILVTDYSSVYFDFAYMRKPILYFHFDSGNWDNEKGYFSYQDMGFGDILNNHLDLTNSVVKLIQSNAETDAKYIERVNKFFKYNDSDNCKRVYKEIIKLNQ